MKNAKSWLFIAGFFGVGIAAFIFYPSPPVLVDLTVVPTGHQEVNLMPDGSLQPRWIGRERVVGLCVEAPLNIDGSQWQARFEFDGQPATAGFEDFTHRSGSALCFSQNPPPDQPTSENFEVCATIRNSFDQQLFRLPCLNGHYDTEAVAYQTLEQRAATLFQERSQSSREDLFAALDRLTADSSHQGFALFGLYLQLAIVYERRREGTPSALEDAARRLDLLPEWLSRPEALAIATTVTYERAMLALTRRQLPEAWRLLAQAEAQVERFAGAQRTVIALQQAEILSQLGAGKEATRRLRTVLEDELWPSLAHYEPEAHAQLGWLLLMDPDAGREEMASAKHHLEAAAASDSIVRDDRERANFHIQMALLASRLGGDPKEQLAEARLLLEDLEPDYRSRLLSGWADVVEGQAALEAGDPQRALELCREAAASPLPRLAGLAWSCLARSHRQLESYSEAQTAFDQALIRHELATPDTLRQDLPLAPSQRADDYYRAARVAVDRKDSNRAWRILESLDRLAVAREIQCLDGDPHPQARAQLKARAQLEARDSLEARRQELWRRLALTEPPFSPHRQRQLEPARNAILEALEELHRMLLLACRDDSGATGSPDFRAFALPDETILLKRRGDRGATLARRSRLKRGELRARLDQLAAAQQNAEWNDSPGDGDSPGDSPGDSGWRELARPLAQALVPPDPEKLSEVTLFALHGVLQKAPLAALPISGSSLPEQKVSDADDGGWLADMTTPVLLPALASSLAPATTSSSTRQPVFVIDPLLNLPSGAQGLDTYRQLFPEATFLYGHEATRSAVLAAAGEASFLHLDAHGLLDATFPGLSGLQMADGLLTAADFVDLPRVDLPHARTFINLSGCQTGRSSDTADSGRYGLGGALLRLGASWVIASGATIEDRLSRDFNQSFYRHYRTSSSVPKSFAAAQAALRSRYPAASWSNLILLGQPIDGSADPQPKDLSAQNEVDDAT